MKYFINMEFASDYSCQACGAEYPTRAVVVLEEHRENGDGTCTFEDFTPLCGNHAEVMVPPNTPFCSND